MAKNRQISFRVPEEEYQRLAAVHERAKERTMGYAPLGDVIREALGLIPLKVITAEERNYISGLINSLSETKKAGPLPRSDISKIRGGKHG